LSKWTVLIAATLAVLLAGPAQALQVEWTKTLDQAMQYDQKQQKWKDSDVASRDGYYYQIKGPAVAYDDKSKVILVAWEDWSEGGQIVGKIGLKALDEQGNEVAGATVDPGQGNVLFGPALVAYDRGKFLLAVVKVSRQDRQTKDYGDLYVYKVTVDAQNKQITVDNAKKVASNAAYPHLVYLGEDKNGNRYVAVVYEAWGQQGGQQGGQQQQGQQGGQQQQTGQTGQQQQGGQQQGGQQGGQQGKMGDVVLQVLKIDTSGNLSVVLGNPVVIKQRACKEYVHGNEHYFGHARPVASVYEEGGKKYLIVALTDYSNANPDLSYGRFYGQWNKCHVRAFVIELPSDLSTLGSAQLSPVEVQGGLTEKDETSEAPWVAGNVIVYRAGPLWGGMSGSDTGPDIYAALIVREKVREKGREEVRWVFKSVKCVYRRIYTQTAPCVVHVYDETNGSGKVLARHYLVVFSDNSGGFGKERLAGALLRCRGGQLLVLAQYDLTGYGNGVYYFTPTAVTVDETFGNARVAVAFYKGDTGYGGHNRGDVVLDLVNLGGPIDEMVPWMEHQISELDRKRMDLQQDLESVKGDVKALKNDVDNLKKKVGSLEGDLKGVKGKVGDLEGKVSDLEGKVKDLEKRVSELEKQGGKKGKGPVLPVLALVALLPLAARRR